MSKFCGLLFFFFILTCNSHAEIKLTFGLYTADKPTVMVANFRPILNHLEDKLTEQFSEEVHIRLQVFSTYEKGVEAIATGEVDFTQLGPASLRICKKSGTRPQDTCDGKSKRSKNIQRHYLYS